MKIPQNSRGMHLHYLEHSGASAYNPGFNHISQESDAFHDESICPCINDVENNGVLEELKKLTMKVSKYYF